MTKLSNHKEKILGIVIIAAIIAAYFAYSFAYQNQIYIGVKIGELNLGSHTITEVEEMISQEVTKYDKEGLAFIYQDKEIIISPTVVSFEPDLAYPLTSFKVRAAAIKAISWGRQGSFFKKFSQRVKALTMGTNIDMIYDISEQDLVDILREHYSNYEFPAKNAALKIKFDDNHPSVTVTSEELGKVLDYEAGIKNLKDNFNNLNNQLITLNDKTDYPKIYKKDTLNIEILAENLINLAPIELNHENRQWLINNEQLADWLSLESPQEKALIKLDVNEDKIRKFLKVEIAPNIDKDPIRADFVVKNEKVVSFQLEQEGLKLKIEDTILKIKKSILITKKNVVNLTIEELRYDTSNNLDLGIKEVIGTGHSDFSGSPSNRRHNIQTGADALDGVLVKPGQEFSLMETLGEIEAKTGYLPELVIRGNETIPEYGGGLCQIGTTVFRTALGAGLEITERRNHSYRVSYYEPAGTDATIYSPKPDFKFLNNTTDHIMIQSRIEGDDLYFDFWGTSDGRLASTTYPVIYNIKEPPETKYIESEEMEPGEVKCTERAHNGADAYFDYTITYPETTIAPAQVIEERFYSRYVPWQEVCLVGKEKATTTERIIIDTDTATTTE